MKSCYHHSHHHRQTVPTNLQPSESVAMLQSVALVRRPCTNHFVTLIPISCWYCWVLSKDEWRVDLQEEEGGCRCYTCWQEMVMWQWSEKLKTGGDGVKESHVNNLLHSRILDRRCQNSTYNLATVSAASASEKSMCNAWSHHSPAFLIHSIIYIGHSPPTTISLQS